jgi:hypothetical protein
MKVVGDGGQQVPAIKDAAYPLFREFQVCDLALRALTGGPSHRIDHKQFDV